MTEQHRFLFFRRWARIDGGSLKLIFIVIGILVVLLPAVLLLTRRNVEVTRIEVPQAYEGAKFTLVFHFQDIDQSVADDEFTHIKLPPESSLLPLRNVCVEEVIIGYPRADFEDAIVGSIYRFESLCVGGHTHTIDVPTSEKTKDAFVAFADEMIFEQADNDGFKIEDDTAIAYEYADSVILIKEPPSYHFPYWFPFDPTSLDLIVLIEVSAQDASGKSISRSMAPDVASWVTLPDWDESISITTEDSELLGHKATHVHIDLRRPLAYRVLAPVLLASLAAFVFALIFVRETGSFLEVAVAILLGLWGAREVLIPGNISGPTWLNSAILGLYVSLVLMVPTHFLWRWLDTCSRTSVPEGGHENPIVRIPQDTPMGVNLPERFLADTHQPLDDPQAPRDLYQIVSLGLLGLLAVLVGLLFFRKRKLEE
jgi:hypothetical protein